MVSIASEPEGPIVFQACVVQRACIQCSNRRGRESSALGYTSDSTTVRGTGRARSSSDKRTRRDESLRGGAARVPSLQGLPKQITYAVLVWRTAPQKTDPSAHLHYSFDSPAYSLQNILDLHYRAIQGALCICTAYKLFWSLCSQLRADFTPTTLRLTTTYLFFDTAVSSYNGIRSHARRALDLGAVRRLPHDHHP